LDFPKTAAIAIALIAAMALSKEDEAQPVTVVNPRLEG
jgi:hypothetical protein